MEYATKIKKPDPKVRVGVAIIGWVLNGPLSMLILPSAVMLLYRIPGQRDLVNDPVLYGQLYWFGLYAVTLCPLACLLGFFSRQRSLLALSVLNLVLAFVWLLANLRLLAFL